MDPAKNERVSYEEYVTSLSTIVGAPSASDGKTTEWTHGAYLVRMTNNGDGYFGLEYLTDGRLEDAVFSATFPAFLEEKARSIGEFLGGPTCPLPPPKKYAVDEQQIVAIQLHLMRVQQQVYRMMDNRRWNRVFQEIVARNPALLTPNQLIAHFHRVFLDYEILAVRRQAKHENASLSLKGVMLEVRDHAAQLTREWHHRLWRGETKRRLVIGTAGPFVSRLADQTFGDFADESGERVDPAIVEADLTRFEIVTDPIVHYSDKLVAHDDRRGLGKKYTPDAFDLDGAVDAVALYTSRYSRLLLVRSSHDMIPIGTTSTLRAFCEPWIRSDDEVRAIADKFGLRDL